MKKNIILVLVTAIIFAGIGVFATSALRADQINYDENTTVKDKIDELYQVADSSKSKYGSFTASTNGGGSATSTPVTIDVGFEYTFLEVWTLDAKGGGTRVSLYTYEANSSTEMTTSSGNATVSRTDTTFSFKNSSWYNGSTIYYMAVK